MTTHPIVPGYDPIGPVTPAWSQFDKALISYARGESKAYHNHRQHMIKCLRTAQVPDPIILQWCQQLLSIAKSGDMGPDGEWI